VVDVDVEPVVVVEIDVNELVEVEELGPYGVVDNVDELTGAVNEMEEPVDVDELGPYGVVVDVDDEPVLELEIDEVEAVIELLDVEGVRVVV